MTQPRAFALAKLLIGDQVMLHFSDETGSQDISLIGLVVVAGDMPTITAIEQANFTAITIQILGTMTLETEWLSPFRGGMLDDSSEFNRLIYVQVGLDDTPRAEMRQISWTEIRRPSKRGNTSRLIWTSREEGS